MKRDMTSGNVTVSLLYFVIPLTIGNILQQLYNIIDTYIVGKYVGSLALSAVGSVSNIIFLFNAVVLGIKAGLTVICSECYGKGDEREFNISRYTGLILILLFGVICTLAGIIGLGNVMKLLKVPAEIYKAAAGYLRIIILGYPFVFLFNYGISIAQSRGDSSITFISLLISTICNIVLDIILICNFNLGVNGAAIATVISQIISFVIVKLYLWIRVPEKR